MSLKRKHHPRDRQWSSSSNIFFDTVILSDSVDPLKLKACSSSSNPKSQLIGYPNGATMESNDKQWCG